MSESVQATTTSPASNATKARESSCTTVTPTQAGPGRKEKLDVCRIRVSGITYENESAPGFDLHLIPTKHGLYDMLEVIYDEVLHKLTKGYRTISSNLWTLKYDNVDYISHDDHEFRIEYATTKTLVLSAEERRVFQPENGGSSLRLQKKMKGSFSLDHKPLSFSFDVEDILVDNIENNEVEWTKNYPKIFREQSGLRPVTDKPGAGDYLDVSDMQAADSLRIQYEEFMKGKNCWKERMVGSTLTYDPSKPKMPEWNRIENRIVGMFILGGFKFAQAWKSGMQYAFPHRSKSATQGRFYALKGKDSYMIEMYAKGQSKKQLIIKAKELCRELMKDMLDHGPPKRSKRPRDVDYQSDEGRMMLMMGTIVRDKHRVGGFLPERIRTRH